MRNLQGGLAPPRRPLLLSRVGARRLSTVTAGAATAGTAAAATTMASRSSSRSRSVSPPASPQLARMSWRNPTLFLSQASASGARGLMQLVSVRRSRLRLHAQADDEEGAALSAALAPEPLLPTSWETVVALAALSVMICYADRSNISTAIIPMADQFGWASGSQGVILSMFFLGYLLTQLLGGALADRYGGKGVLAAGVAFWSLFTILTPPAAFLGIPALIGMRIAMGLGEGVAFPAIHSIIARSVPAEKQSTSVAVVTAASYVGTALAFGLAPTIIDELGWPWVFYLFGAMAVLWLPAWAVLQIEGGSRSDGASGGSGKGFNILELFSSSDAGDAAALSSSKGEASAAAAALQRGRSGGGGGTNTSGMQLSGSQGLAGEGSQQQRQRQQQQAALAVEQTRALMAPDREDAVSDADTEWSDGVAYAVKARQEGLGVGFAALIKTKEVWAICAAQYTGSWGFYGLLNWLPSFFKDYYHVEISQLASFTLLPYVVQGSVGAASGIVADKLLARGWPVKRVRRVLQTIGMLGPAACMLAAASPLTDGSPSAASAWVTLGLGLNALTLAGVSVSQLDIAPKHAGIVFAAGNTCATLAGLLAVPLTGYVLEATASWSLVFGITAAHYVVGAALFALWVGDRPLPQDG